MDILKKDNIDQNRRPQRKYYTHRKALAKS